MAVPANWRIHVEVWQFDRCNGSQLVSRDIDSSTGDLREFCYGPDFKGYRSARYWFLDAAQEASPSLSTDCSLVDTLTLKNSSRYSLLGLSEDEVSETVCIWHASIFFSPSDKNLVCCYPQWILPRCRREIRSLASLSANDNGGVI